jgi:hypothetical protein
VATPANCLAYDSAVSPNAVSQFRTRMRRNTESPFRSRGRAVVELVTYQSRTGCAVTPSAQRSETPPLPVDVDSVEGLISFRRMVRVPLGPPYDVIAYWRAETGAMTGVAVGCGGWRSGGIPAAIGH